MKRILPNVARRRNRAFLKNFDRVLLIALSVAMIVFSIGCGADRTKDRQQGVESSQQAQTPSGDAAGGQSAQGEADENHTTAEQSVQGDRVIVSRSIEFAQVNDRPYGMFEGKDEIAVFAKAIRTASEIEGLLNVDFPDYDVVIDQNGKRSSIHLWLARGSEQGMFTYVNETGTGYKLTEQSTKELVELIWHTYYDTDAAIANGDVVDLIDEVHNAEEWLDFVRDVKNGQPGEVQVVQYTIEGGPIFHNLIFAGDSIRYRYDNSHDAFGQAMDLTDFCESIASETTDEGKVYKLAGCSGESAGWFKLLLPGK